MRNKPGSIILLALLQLIVPFTDILIGAYTSYEGINEHLSRVYSESPLMFFMNNVAVRLITAYAIYSVKRWSLPVCIGSMIWFITQTPGLTAQYIHPMGLPVQIASHLVNLGLIYFFLMPEVRNVYWNKRLRWWESVPRYRIQKKGHLFYQHESIDCKIIDISTSGVFITSEKSLTVGNLVVLEFSQNKNEYTLKGKILHRQNKSQSIFGIQFNDNGENAKKKLEALLIYLENSTTQRRPERTNNIQEFLNWLKSFLTTGKGAIPGQYAEKQKKYFKKSA